MSLPSLPPEGEVCNHCDEELGPNPVEAPSIYCPSEWYCSEDCRDAAEEAAFDRQSEDGETFRGREAAAFDVEQQAAARRFR